jgi:hypothetical protein
MTTNAEKEQQLISWRREKILSLMSQGIISGRELSQKLQVSEPTVSRDIAYLSKRSKENLKVHVEQRIPLEMEKMYTGLHVVLAQAFSIVNQESAKISEKLSALQVILHTYNEMSELLSNDAIIKDITDKFKVKREQFEAAAKEIQNERQKDLERKRLGLTIEEYEAQNKDKEDDEEEEIEAEQ